MRDPREGVPILVAGIGNILMRDDGVGVHAAGRLQAMRLPGVVVEDLGTAILQAEPILASFKATLATSSWLSTI